MKAIYWVIGTIVVALVVFVSVMFKDTQRNIPKVKLSYFSNEAQIAQAVTKSLALQETSSQFFWVGVEPDKKEQLTVVQEIKNELERINGPFSEVIVDAELELPASLIMSLNTSQNVHLKQNMEAVGPVLEKLEKENKKYFLVTASLYSNSLIKKNQIHQLKEKHPINPLTISMAYFAALPEEEQNILFKCNTDDATGISAWGCAVTNKARAVRRKFKPDNQKPWSGLMDLTGQNDYMLLLRKAN